MKSTVWLILIAALWSAGCSEKKPAATTAAKTNASEVGQNPLTAPVDYLGALAKGKKAAERVADTAQLKQAIDFFHENEDRWPADLNEVISKHYLPSLPKPPYGMKFDYDPKTGQVRVVNQ